MSNPDAKRISEDFSDVCSEKPKGIEETGLEIRKNDLESKAKKCCE
jgi:hypothetical protein